MKYFLIFISTLLCLACMGKSEKNEPNTTVVGSAKETKEAIKNTRKGFITYTMEGKTYKYDNINWKKSKIKNEEDLRLRILQSQLPNVEFKFPEIRKALSKGEGNFKIPDLNRGLKQLQLKFFDETRVVDNRLNKHIVFRKGEIQAKLSGNNFTMSFTGEGGPMVDKTITFPISGSININI